MRKKMNKKAVQTIMFILLAGLMLTPVFARGSKDDDSGGSTESGTENNSGNDSDKGKMREDSDGTFRDDNGNGKWDQGEKRWDNNWDNKDIQEAIKRVAEASAALEAAKKSGSRVEIKEVMETLNEAKNALSKVCDKWSEMTGQKSKNLYDAALDLVSYYGKTAANYVATIIGDPVLLSTGQYVHSETDLHIRSGLQTISVTRTYVSGRASEKAVYSGDGFGALWQTGLDMRIVRGTSISLESALSAQDDVTSEQEGYLAEIQRYAAEDPDCGSILQEMQALLAQSMTERERLRREVEKARRLQNLNAYVLDGIESSLVNCGNNSLIFIAANGLPVLYEYSGNGTWRAPATSGREQERIQSLDGKDAESTAGFVRSSKNGVREYFDAWGRVQKITDRAGNSTLFSHNGKLLEKITTAENIQITFLYANNLIAAIQSSTGERVSYAYTNGMLSSVTDTEGDSVRYQYDSAGNLTRIIKPDGSFIGIEYGFVSSVGNKMVSATVNEEGFRETFSYSLQNKTTTHTDHAGVQVRYTYDDNGNTTRVETNGKTTNYQYNEQGQLIRKMDNSATTYSYDQRNNLLLSTYSDGSSEAWQYNSFDEVTRYIDRDGITTLFFYDEVGNCTSVERGGLRILTMNYDGAGRLILVVTGNGTTHIYSYDKRGNTITHTTAQGDIAVQEFSEYDSRNRLVRVFDGKSDIRYSYSPHSLTITNSFGIESVYVYNNRKDVIAVEERDTVTNEKRIYRYEYDKRHLPAKCVVSNGVETILETTYEYDAAGKMLAEILGEWRIDYSYDSAGRLSSRAQSKAGTSEIYTETFEYGGTAQGETVTIKKPLGITTTAGFDPWQRLVSITDPNGDILHRQLSMQGRILKEQTSYGGYYAFEYDALGRLFKLGEDTSTKTLLSYNGAGNLLRKTDSEGNIIQYEFNVFGLSKETAADYTHLYFYDAQGRLVKKIIGQNENNYEQCIDFEYADNGRTVKITEGGLYFSTLKLNAWEEIISVTNGEGCTQRAEYDALGRMTVKIDAYGNKTKILYNAIGNIAVIEFPNGSKEYFEYNHTGQLVKTTDDAGIKWQGKYDEAGRLIEEKARPGVDKKYSYDKGGRITEVKNGDETVVSYEYKERGKSFSFVDGMKNSYNYFLDEFGRITREQNRLGKNQFYEYTAEGKLRQKTDFAGNRTLISEQKNNRLQTISVTPRSGAQKSSGVQILRTDMSGNIVEAKGESGALFYFYDAGGRLIKQIDEGANETTMYRYDKAGRRVFMQSNDREVSYVYGKNDELLFVSDNKQRLSVSFEYDMMGREIKRAYGNGVTQRVVYDKIGRIIALSEYNPSGLLIRFEGYLFDAEGRRTHAIDKNGNVTFYEYDKQSRISSVWYPYSEEKRTASLQEAVEAGLYFSETAGGGENRLLSAQENERLISLLQIIRMEQGAVNGQTRAPFVVQHVLKEMYSYDANGNRSAKTTGFGVIRYSYDAENRLLSAGGENNQGLRYAYDDMGNMIAKKSLYNTIDIGYNEFNRMSYLKMVVKGIANAADVQYETRYAYDAFGRRTIEQDASSAAVRTLFDGMTFDVIREQETFSSGSFTRAGESSVAADTDSGRYRFIGGESAESRTRQIGNDSNNSSGRYRGARTMLFADGRAVAVSQGASASRSYFGTDTIGSIKSVTGENGEAKNLYDYDAFGTPTGGNFSAGNNLGYAGKQFDALTGFYNYGYRDYSPQEGRFTTIDPIRDGLNWFSYVHNDPVNYVDFDGLLEVWGDDINGKPVVIRDPAKIKEETSIVIQRNSTPGNYNDTLSVKIGSQTVYETSSVQSEANIADPKLTKKYDGKTLPAGEYTGKLYDTSGSYLNAIFIESPDFFIHPNEVTNQAKRDTNTAKGISNGPFEGDVSAGCQVPKTPDFNEMTSTLQDIGFKYKPGNYDTIPVTIKSDPRKGW